MRFGGLDFSTLGKARVVAGTVLGTLLCIAVAFAVDSYSFDEGWRWGDAPINNLVIPLILAPPAFYILLGKLRELAIAHHELSVVSATDPLTSLLNRRAFTAIVDAYLDRMTGPSLPREGALLVIDVDHFKAVNDSFGHGSGDEALKLIAETIRSSVRENDVVGRLGGEEFCVFMPGTGQALTQQLAERIRASVSAVEFSPEGHPYPLSVSVGGASFSGSASFGDLYRQADFGLYEAKRNGRNRVELIRVALGDDGRPPMVH